MYFEFFSLSSVTKRRNQVRTERQQITAAYQQGENRIPLIAVPLIKNPLKKQFVQQCECGGMRKMSEDFSSSLPFRQNCFREI